MATQTAHTRSIGTPDEVREIDKGRIEFLRLGDVMFARAVIEPGWRWSESVKPIAGTESCEFRHVFFQVSGTLHVRMDDGEEYDVRAGDLAVIEPGHDAWVVGQEPCVTHDFGGEDEDFAKPPEG